MRIKRQHFTNTEAWALKLTKAVGSLVSLALHTFVFLSAFALGFAGFDWNTILLVLTTMVSLEAIYLAILIQMTVNRNTESLEEVEEDIDEIQVDIGELQEDVDEIQEDVDEIQEDVQELDEEKEQPVTLEMINQHLLELRSQLEELKTKKKK